ncbi:hypothetical protein A2686_03025 [Candidatus Woesebacteria bacterium RIFCSPHIGHO2_01_FULL_38_10]|uniref:Uncharacterized protein n=1 Tax=Candidatus Woesebacteria bacterium RIFCSPLOWO2_01_FULL_39_10b TaxID=1802517 RepID=A0A1F8B863_9BACT|nr:MAG: hypothetical protein A2686_03025 [Candidatus Woesebacteria bacterium RIFCSPHIGHO2_01_FULL_38_10]OGM60120.1 MAG: hypothetical protein A2892_00840 [Candidatus Woesebacteria bacterium RIFCSPLOWO2_01_FULL_39_10b]
MLSRKSWHQRQVPYGTCQGRIPSGTRQGRLLALHSFNQGGCVNTFLKENNKNELNNNVNIKWVTLVKRLSDISLKRNLEQEAGF